MNVILFGATGMIGQGVLRECLRDPGVQRVLAVGRGATGVSDPKLRDLIHANLADYSAIESELAGFDAAFFCLGITSAGQTEAAYRRITVDLPVAAATVLARLNPGMTFVYVSGQGADSSMRGRIMWARVKGEAEHALFQLPFKRVYAIRPGLIQPMDGIRSRTGWYNAFYAVTRPMAPLLRMLPRYVTTTRAVGRAMLALARGGPPRQLIENREINQLAGRAEAS